MRNILSCEIDEADRRRLRLAAALTGTTQTAIVREAISDRLAAIESERPGLAVLDAAA